MDKSLFLRVKPYDGSQAYRGNPLFPRATYWNDHVFKPCALCSQGPRDDEVLAAIEESEDRFFAALIGRPL